MDCEPKHIADASPREADRQLSRPDHELASEFILKEYEDLYQNVMHMEKQLFEHLTFYTGLFTGTLAASVAMLGLLSEANAPIDMPALVCMLSVLFFALTVVGRIELRMTTELRVSKIKFVEGIAVIRQYFVDKAPEIARHLVLPVGLHKAPPYLRTKSKDWYQVLYISLINGLSTFLCLACLSWLFSQFLGRSKLLIACVPSIVLIVALLLSSRFAFFIFWTLGYKSVRDYCERYDSVRESKMGAKSEYDLLVTIPPKPILQRTLGDWIELHEQHRAASK